MPEMLETTNSSSFTVPSDDSTVISSKTSSSTRNQLNEAWFPTDTLRAHRHRHVLWELPVLQLLLKQHHNIVLFYLATSSMKRKGNMMSPKPVSL